MPTNYTKLKTNLRLAIQRLKMMEKKKSELALKARKEIAEYISQGKPDRARIRVECIIREDYLVEAMELVEMFCDLLIARFGLIQQEKTLDEGLAEAVSSLIWVAPRLQSDCQELKVIAELFTHKYGKQYALAARENAVGTVSPKLMAKLSVQAPPKILVESYMIEIAKLYNVPFEPDASVMEPKGEEALEYSTSQGVPLIDFGAGAAAMGPPPLPFERPIGFDVVGEKGALGPLPPGPVQQPSNPKLLDSLRDQPAPEPKNPSPPPMYDSIIHNPNANANTNRPVPKPRTTVNSDEFPELPDVPHGTPNHLPNPGNSNDAIDFDDLAKRFEALKKKK